MAQSCLETHVLPIALCKSTRIRLVPNSWIVCFELWHRAFSLRYTELFPSGTQSFFPPVHRAFSLGAQSSSPRHRAFTLRHTRLITSATSKPPHDTQSFLPPVHRAFSLRYTELLPPVHKAFSHRCTELNICCTELLPMTQSFDTAAHKAHHLCNLQAAS